MRSKSTSQVQSPPPDDVDKLFAVYRSTHSNVDRQIRRFVDYKESLHGTLFDGDCRVAQRLNTQA